MATYYWDVGFNYPDASTSGTNPMQAGFLEKRPDLEAVAASANVGDMIGFALYDLASMGSPSGISGQPSGDFTSPYSVVSCVLTSSGVGDSPNSPFSGDLSSLSFSGMPPSGNTGYGPSVIFSSGNTNVCFPRWTAKDDGANFLFQAVNSGTFNFSFSAVISGSDGNKTFVHDPEMIIGGTD